MAFPWSGTSLDAFFLSTLPVEGESEVYYADLTTFSGACPSSFDHIYSFMKKNKCGCYD